MKAKKTILNNSLNKGAIFPSQINRFYFVSLLNQNSQRSRFRFAIYKDKSEKKYVCKLWTGKKTDLKRKWIINEISAYRLLNEIIDKSRKDFSEKYSKIIVPKIYFESITNEKILFLVDQVSGQRLEKESAEKVLNSYELINDFLIEISKKIELNNSKVLKRTTMDYLILFHYYLFRSVLKYPKNSFLFLKIIPTFYKGLFQLAADKNSVLVLRDLCSEDNVFLSKNKLTIIDLEQLTLTKKIIQISSFVVSEISNNKFLKYFFNSEKFYQINKDKKALSSFKAMLIYGSLVEMVATYRPDKNLVKNQAIFVINKALTI